MADGGARSESMWSSTARRILDTSGWRLINPAPAGVTIENWMSRKAACSVLLLGYVTRVVDGLREKKGRGAQWRHGLSVTHRPTAHLSQFSPSHAYLFQKHVNICQSSGGHRGSAAGCKTLGHSTAGRQASRTARNPFPCPPPTATRPALTPELTTKGPTGYFLPVPPAAVLQSMTSVVQRAKRGKHDNG